MKRNANGAFLIGAVVLVAGVAALAYGFYLYRSVNQPDLASVPNKLGKFFGKPSAVETQGIGFMIGGGAAVLIGAFLALSRRR